MKRQKHNDPFVNLVLDEEEKLLEEALENGDYETDANLEETKKMLQEAATQYLELHKSKPVTIRINQLDLIKIKAKAKRQQIPYQTLLGALLHQFADGEKELRIK